MINESKKENIIYLTIYLKKLIDKDFDARLAEYDLTGQQGRILFFINCNDKEIHQNDIENEFHLSKSTVSGLVKRMEKKGVITTTKQHPYAVIKITDKGKDIVEHLKQHRNEAREQLTRGFNANEKNTICDLLIKLITNMEGGNA